MGRIKLLYLTKYVLKKYFLEKCLRLMKNANQLSVYFNEFLYAYF